MFCINCGASNSDAAKFCYQCGQTIVFPGNPQQVKPLGAPNPKKLKPLSPLYKGAVVVAAVILGGIATAILYNALVPRSVPPTNANVAINAANENTPTPEETKPQKTKKTPNLPAAIQTPSASVENDVLSIVNETFAVKAGSYRYYQFTLGRPSHVSGRVEAKGGNDDIDTIVLDADEFTNFKNTGRFRSYYRSGYVTIGNIDLQLSPGVYYVVFSNSAAILTNKVVKAEINAE